MLCKVFRDHPVFQLSWKDWFLELASTVRDAEEREDLIDVRMPDTDISRALYRMETAFRTSHAQLETALRSSHAQLARDIAEMKQAALSTGNNQPQVHELSPFYRHNDQRSDFVDPALNFVSPQRSTMLPLLPKQRLHQMSKVIVAMMQRNKVSSRVERDERSALIREDLGKAEISQL